MFTKKIFFLCNSTSHWNKHVGAVSSGGIVKRLQNVSPEKRA
jgi:hypothetical protein